MKHLTSGRAGIVVGTALLASPVALAIGYDPSLLLPPTITNNLYVLEKGCDCILEITPSKKITEKLSEQALLYFLNSETHSYYNDISYGSNAIITLKDGSIIFTVSASSGDDYEDYVIKLDSYDKLSILIDEDDVSLVTGVSDVDLESLVLGADGNLYIGEDESNDILKYVLKNKYLSRLVKEEDFNKLGKDFDFDVQPGATADEQYLYFPSDNTPNGVFRVSYDGYKIELFAVGPKVDPNNLSKDNNIWVTNDDYHPPVSGKKYYPGDKHAPYKPKNISGTFKLTFEKLDDYYTYPPIHTGPIKWDATPKQVAKAIKEALGVSVSVSGRGTVGTPWTFNNPKGYELQEYVTEYIYNADLTISSNSGDNKEAIEAQNHIEALAADAHYGDIKIKLEVENVPTGSSVIISDEITLSLGDSPQAIKDVIVKNSQLTHNDFSVKGSGTVYSPWVFSFMGDYKYTQIEFEIQNDSYDYIKPYDVRTGTIQDARAFDDPDGFITRRWDGTLTLPDDSDGHTVYNIDRLGNVSTLITEWQLVVVNKGPVDMEGGVAYDNKGYLYLSNHNDNSLNTPNEEPSQNSKGGNIFKLSPSGKLSIWVDAKDIIKVTKGSINEVEIEGIAFDQTIGSKSSFSSPWYRY